MSENVEQAPALVGCNFDKMTAAAVHGKNALLCVSDADTGELLAIQGQQGLSFQVDVETSETKTKDGEGWSIKTPGVKSWNCSCDGLYALGDKARTVLVRSIKEGVALCLGMYVREIKDGKYTYTPIRKGMAISNSDALDAPSDDNITYSTGFEGTGALWMIESATQDEVDRMTVVVDAQKALPESPGQGSDGGAEG